MNSKVLIGILKEWMEGAVGLISSKSQFYKVALYLGLNETCI